MPLLYVRRGSLTARLQHFPGWKHRFGVLGVRDGGTVGPELVTYHDANALLGPSCQTSSSEPVKYRHGPNQLHPPPEEAIQITYRTALACWLPQRRDGTINHAETARARDHQRVGCDGTVAEVACKLGGHPGRWVEIWSQRLSYSRIQIAC